MSKKYHSAALQRKIEEQLRLKKQLAILHQKQHDRRLTQYVKDLITQKLKERKTNGKI